MKAALIIYAILTLGSVPSESDAACRGGLFSRAARVVEAVRARPRLFSVRRRSAVSSFSLVQRSSGCESCRAHGVGPDGFRLK